MGDAKIKKGFSLAAGMLYILARHVEGWFYGSGFLKLLRIVVAREDGSLLDAEFFSGSVPHHCLPTAGAAPAGEGMYRRPGGLDSWGRDAPRKSRRVIPSGHRFDKCAPRVGRIRHTGKIAAQHDGAGRMDRNDAGSVPKTEARAEARAPVPGTQTAATESMRFGDRSIVDAGKPAVAASAASASAIARDPVGSLCALGIAAHRAQRHQLALALIGRAIVLDPGRAQPHFALGRMLHQAGRLANATARYARAIELEPTHAEAHMNLGMVLKQQGRLDAAAAAFQRTLRLRPDDAEALHNLAAVHFARGDPSRALGAVRRALEIKETPATRSLFARSIRDLASGPFMHELRGFVTRAIAEAWDRPRVIAPVATMMIKQDARLAPLIARAVAAWPARLPFDELLAAAGLAAISADTLLVALLESTHVCDRELERFLTVVRCALLAAAEDRRTSADLEQAGALRFCCALAAQCWINEYVFDVTDDESARVTALAERVASALRADKAVALLPLVLVASYRPLYTVITPEMLDRPWPEPVAGIVRQQVCEPLEERQLAASLPQLTEIDDEVSRRVREQYEQNPYPRWVKLEPPREPTTLEHWLRQTLPSATLAPLSVRNGIDILVAGCGSGQNPITVARTFAGARVLAADLSLASLAHAQRKTRELAIDTIDYAQADILKIGSIGRRFDFVDATGRRDAARPLQRARERERGRGARFHRRSPLWQHAAGDPALPPGCSRRRRPAAGACRGVSGLLQHERVPRPPLPRPGASPRAAADQGFPHRARLALPRFRCRRRCHYALPPAISRGPGRDRPRPVGRVRGGAPGDVRAHVSVLGAEGRSRDEPVAALLFRRSPMMPQPIARSNRQICDGLRFCATPRGALSPISQPGPVTPR